MLGLSRYTPRNLSKIFNVSNVTSCTIRLPKGGGLTIKTLSFLEYRLFALSLSFKFFWFFVSISFLWSCSTIVLRSLDTSVCNCCSFDFCELFLLTVPLATSSASVGSNIQSKTIQKNEEVQIKWNNR